MNIKVKASKRQTTNYPCFSGLGAEGPFANCLLAKVPFIVLLS